MKDVKIAIEKNAPKLKKSLAPWLESSALGSLFWQNGEALSEEEIRFLFYRQSKTKGIQLDDEARPAFALLDKTKSTEFAHNLLEGFLGVDAAAKFKFVLPICAILGDDVMMDALAKLVDYWAANSRGKMGEYAVQSIVMNGSGKALRLVDFFTRKYKSKMKNIGKAALAAFDIAAKELGISRYELSDSLVPNYDFEGLFLPFEVENEAYRGYIGMDMKLYFLDENNKKLKTPPKKTPKETLDKIKLIKKELRAYTKSSTELMEHYMVIERRWSAERWLELFLENPILFAYANQFVWANINANGDLIETFHCSEDQTLNAVDFDEIELEKGSFVSLVHPLNMSEDSLGAWRTYFLDAGIMPLFPQLLRTIVDKESYDVKSTKLLFADDWQVGGYTLLGTMKKRNWAHGPIVDAGGIDHYYKDFPDKNVRAVLQVKDGHGIGWYESDAILGALFFEKLLDEKTGEILPLTWYNNGKAAIPLENVAPVPFSEAVSDVLTMEMNKK